MKKILNSLKKESVKVIVREKNNKKHLLVNGDSSQILSLFPDQSIDLIVTDPPYNAGLNYGKRYNDNLSWEEYERKAHVWFADYSRILKIAGSIYVMNYPEINARLLPFFEDKLGLKLRRWITWHYPTNIGHSKKNFTRSQRSILFLTKSDDYIFNRDEILQLYENPDVGKVRQLIRKGRKGRGAYDFITNTDFIDMEVTRKKKNLFDSFYIDLLKNVSVDRLNKKHPCQLPFSLLEQLIRVSSNEGDVVLDPFAGTFSTSCVAKNLKRNSVGVELNPKFIKLGINRMK
ncbi:MAG: DNA methyltransferase [Candidatus Paceibacterota bacterium]